MAKSNPEPTRDAPRDPETRAGVVKARLADGGELHRDVRKIQERQRCPELNLTAFARKYYGLEQSWPVGIQIFEDGIWLDIEPDPDEYEKDVDYPVEVDTE